MRCMGYVCKAKADFPHLYSLPAGAVLPVWKQLHDVVLSRSLQDSASRSAHPRVLRAILDNGEKIIGAPRASRHPPR